MDNEKSILPLFSKRLITLWDMQQYFTDKMVHVVAKMDYVKETVVWHAKTNLNTDPKWWPEEARKKVQEMLRDDLMPILEQLELTVTKHSCDQLVIAIGALGFEGTMAKVDSLRDTLEGELKQKIFFVLNPEHVKYYKPKNIFGDPLYHDKFPTADNEACEAGKCLALGRSTACVHHLMRAVEVGLRSLAAHLGISKQNDWGKYLDEINEELDKRVKAGKNTPDGILYSEWNAQMWDFKDAYRNRAAHSEKNYNPEEAEFIFLSVKAFLLKISTKLSEEPPKVASS